MLLLFLLLLAIIKIPIAIIHAGSLLPNVNAVVYTTGKVIFYIFYCVPKKKLTP
jgi:surface polysaccharide O-acyltransferase-like enzyme